MSAHTPLPSYEAVVASKNGHIAPPQAPPPTYHSPVHTHSSVLQENPSANPSANPYANPYANPNANPNAQLGVFAGSSSSASQLTLPYANPYTGAHAEMYADMVHSVEEAERGEPGRGVVSVPRDENDVDRRPQTRRARPRDNTPGCELCPFADYISFSFLPERVRPYDPPVEGWDDGSFHTGARACGWPLCGFGLRPRACCAVGAFPTGFLFACGWVAISWVAAFGQASAGMLFSVGQASFAPFMGLAIGQLALGMFGGIGQLATGVFVGGMIKIGKYSIFSLFEDGTLVESSIV